jgi:hypothetical protein
VAVCAIALLATFASAQPPTTRPTLPDSTKLDLFLLIGQSNMAGRGKVEPQDQVINPRIWVLDKEMRWSPAIDPLHWDRPERVGVGPGMGFARTVLEKNPTSTIGLIPAAVGGSSIDLWKKDGEFYRNALSRAKLAKEHGTLRAILWHQGEADSRPEQLADHPAKLKQLITDLRADLGDPNLPVVIGQIGEFYVSVRPDAPKMNQILIDFPKSMPRTACVVSSGLTQMGDNTHFDAAGARELGRRYAKAYFELTE